jgi:hypothetical protein
VLSADTLLLELKLPAHTIESMPEIESGTPSKLRPIMHYAAIWGISDDGYRSALVGSAPQKLRQNLKWIVISFEDTLEEWLAGPEADNPNPTKAYVAFSSMLMASDEILA